MPLDYINYYSTVCSIGIGTIKGAVIFYTQVLNTKTFKNPQKITAPIFGLELKSGVISVTTYFEPFFGTTDWV